jgi:hypothetical protein
MLTELARIRDLVCRCRGTNGLLLEEEHSLAAHARERGLRAEQLIGEWLRPEPQEHRRAKARPTTAAKAVTVPVMSAIDLDFWPVAGDERDDDDEQDGDVCQVCNGSGRDAGGNRCAACGGSGKILNEDDDEQQPEDEE